MRKHLDAFETAARGDDWSTASRLPSVDHSGTAPARARADPGAAPGTHHRLRSRPSRTAPARARLPRSDHAGAGVR
jgi:hypothetical protein